MKALRTIGLAAFLAVFLAGPVLAAQPTVGLGAAGSYAVLGGSTITNTGPTTITGNLGLSPGTSYVSAGVTLNGTKNITNAAALSAQNALTTAYNDAKGRTPVTLVPAELGGQALKAGVYSTDSGAFLLTGTLTLDGENNATAVFIFQVASTLTTASGSSVVLINGASPCNVFWQITSSATIGTNSHFQGTIMALSSITMTTGARLIGRALARNAAVTLDTNVIDSSQCSGSSSTGSLPPTSTSGSQETGSGSSPSILLLLAGLAAGAAFVTIRQLNGIRR